jgi:twitching motility protein PilT
MDLTSLLVRVAQVGASDLHLKLGKAPVVRIDGAIEELDGLPMVTEDDLDEVVDEVTARAPGRRQSFDSTGELDIGYQSHDMRFRVNAFRQRGAISVAFRLIPRDVPTFGSLHMPPGVARLAEEQRGLVLVTGATGTGKSTTLAAMLDHINRTRQQHIVTIEDPIETLHPDHGCIVNQREVGLDTASFAQALRRALRQDPDVILIGEMRDAETAETALQAAESGHLVLSTMHTLDAAETIGRLMEFFPAQKQPMMRSILAGVLRGVISQRLLPRVDGGRIAAVEVLVVNDRVSELIRESRSEEIPTAIRDGEFYDMQSLTQALIDLTLAGLVEREPAANAAPNRHDFLIALSHAEKALAVAGAETTDASSAADATPRLEPALWPKLRPPWRPGQQPGGIHPRPAGPAQVQGRGGG